MVLHYRYEKWFLYLMLGLVCARAHSEDVEIQRAYLDKHKNAHVLLKKKKSIQITRQGHCREPEISEDRRTVASICDVSDDHNSLTLFRNGKIKVLKGDPFVREFKFVEGGQKIAVDIGGLHFAGVEYLYDVSTMKKLDEFSQSKVPVEKRPSWAN
jgi:hypothetical protein